MAKKKGGPPSISPAGLDASSPKGERKFEEDFQVGSWKGMTQWRCKLCKWDTLEGEGAMRAHLATAHTPEVLVRRVTLPLVDMRGEQIVREEVIDG